MGLVGSECRQKGRGSGISLCSILLWQLEGGLAVPQDVTAVTWPLAHSEPNNDNGQKLPLGL